MADLAGNDNAVLSRAIIMFRKPARRWVLLAAVATIIVVQLTVLLRTSPDKLAGYAETVHRYKPAVHDDAGLWNKLHNQRLPHKSEQKKCSEIKIPKSYWATTAASTPAFVVIPDAGQINVDDTVCIRVVVPARKQRVHMAYTPFPNTPWDSVLLDLVGQRTGVSVPVRLQPAMDIRNTFRDESHVYEADVRLRDVDEYRVEGYVEFRDALWNCDGELAPADYIPEPLHIPSTLRVDVVDPQKTSTYNLERYMELPLCTDLDVEGRWVSSDALSFNTDLVPPPDDHGRVWLPYTCRLRRIEYGEFMQCLKQQYPLMHWYGDSNLRRVLKKLTTRGAWCGTSDEHQTRTCICEDYKEEFTPFNATYRELIIDFDESGGQMVSNKDADFLHVPDNHTRIYYHKWEGLSSKNKPAWQAPFEESVTSRFGVPSVAMISLTNWDAAFDTRAHFSLELERLFGIVRQEYPPTTELIIRTGQYFCCRSDYDPPDTRAYSRLRNAYFDQYVVAAFQEQFGHTHKVRVWNVASISEHRPWSYRNETTECNSNHARSELVEIENQVLFNAMCN
ncbi:hypothetical protein EV180_001571 [Coemansia sp. RSA 518]|nr:hypothetical protein EV181_001705 [Coemansia sp. RSA 532]KAJ2229284.1 hypothetical protein EV180_001571 [Coemansia sp. RSA 518]KAJ2292478.1 hypothetical protein IW141_001854 [Coemansia sp. RSA 355]